tara:strand:- start:3595 stop:5589 length:1995 start_codon:yes stop_codon:yes gene_type:complete
MGFLVSPGVQVNEIDLTNVIPAVSTSIAAISLPAQKGPVEEIVDITSEQELVQTFGKPNGSNFEPFFVAANFLKYGNALRVVRPTSAIVNAAVSGTKVLVKNDDHYQENYASGEGNVGEWAARSAGTWGNSIGVSICPSATAFEENIGSSNLTIGEDAVGATSILVDDGSAFNVGDLISFSTADASSTATNFAHISGDEGNEYEITAISSNTLTVRLDGDANGSGVKAIVPDNTFIRRRWRWYDLFATAPGTSAWSTENGRGSNDELHVVVYDTTGDITGNDVDVAGQRAASVIETYAGLSKNSAAKTAQGSTNYYPDVIFTQSQFVYWMDHNSSGSNWGTDTTTTYTAVNSPTLNSLTGGTDDYSVTVGEHTIAYDRFKDAETVDVNLILGGKTPDDATNGDTYGTMLIDLVESRKDCICFISPARADVVNVSTALTQTNNVKTYFDTLPSSSYAVFDSGYKYMYDKYNDVYRHVPLNGDVAGTCANTDIVTDPWFSPAGFNRGQIRGAVKLAYDPKQAHRDTLYKARVNPVVNFSGQGVHLFGDKTALTKPSAFDRINVRRLFIVLEKAIATASKFQLFEFNDEFTRAQFRNLVEPFLRDVQGRRGITDFSVVCDASNNTGEVIDRNEFIADIFIKPARSINFITLNFIATRTGVAFSEVGG